MILITLATSEGSGEPVHPRGLARAFAVRTHEIWNIKSEMRSFKSNENIHKKEGGSYYVVSANKASSVTL